MSTIPIELPLVGGVREDIAREILPNGLIRSMSNYRIAKPGRIVRREGYAQGVYTPPAEYPDADYVASLTEWRGQRVAVAQENADGSSLPGDDAGVFRRTQDQAVWRVVSGVPISTAPLPLYRARAGATMTRVSVATVNDYTLMAWEDGGSLGVALRDPDGTILRYSTAYTTCDEVTTIAAGTRLYVFWRSNANLRYSYMDTATDSDLQGAVTLYTNLGTADPAWDVSSDGTEFAIAYHKTGGTLVAASYSSTVSLLTTDEVSVVPDDGVAIARDGTTGAICVYATGSSTSLNAVTWDGTIASGNRGTPFVLDATYSPSYGPFTVSCETGQYWTAWSESVTAGGYTTEATRYCTISTVSGSKGTTYTHWRAIVGSKPFGGFCWLHYPRATQYDRQYMLSNGFNSTEGLNLVARAGMRVAAPSAGAAATMPIAHIVPDGAGNLLWAAREIYQGDIAAPGGETRYGAVSYRWSLTSTARGSMADLGGLHFAGGVHKVWDGASLALAPWTAPAATSSWCAIGAAGGLTGTAYYKIVYAVYDGLGNVWRSEPSDTISQGGLSSQAVDFNIEGVGYSGFWAEVYREHTTGSYRYVGSVELDESAQYTAYTDTGASVATRPLIYTTGGEPVSYPTPPSDIVAYWGGRLFAASDDRVYYSHQYARTGGSNQAPWMVEVHALQLPARVTGLAPLDSSMLIFTADRVFAISGEGPNRLGQNVYQSPQQIASEVGCSDWRSVAIFRDGVAFRSSRGLEMIPRGSYGVMPFGDPVEDTLATYATTTQAVVRAEHDQIRWTVRNASDGRILCYDYVDQSWSIETAPAYDCAALFAAGYVVGSCSAVVGVIEVAGGAWVQGGQYVDDDGDDSSDAYTSELETGDLRGSGNIGWQRVGAVNVLGRLRAAATLSIAVAMDGEDDFDDSESISHDVISPETLAAWNTQNVTYAVSDLVESGGTAIHGIYLDKTLVVGRRYAVTFLYSNVHAERGLQLEWGSSAYVTIALGGASIEETGGTDSATITALGGGSYQLDWEFTSQDAADTFYIVGTAGTPSATVYASAGYTIATINALTGLTIASETARAVDSPLRQEFAPAIQKCEAVRVRVRDASTTEGVELTALRLDVAQKRRAGRIRGVFRS